MASPRKRRRKRNRGLPLPIPPALDPVRRLRVMGRLVRRVVSRPGSAPGTLVHTGERVQEAVRIRVLDYSESALEEREVETVEELRSLLEPGTVSWINVDGLHDVEQVQQIGELFEIHPLVLEAVVVPGQRPKVEEYDGHLFVVLHMLTWDDEAQRIDVEQVSVLVGASYVLSFQERTGDVFEPVRIRLREGRGRIRKKGGDYLAYALIDAVVDNYFEVLEKLGDLAETMDQEVTEDPEPETMRRLHDLKRETLVVRKSVWPLRETTGGLMRSESALIEESTRVFLRDVHDHAVYVIDTVETLRDAILSMKDLYLSNVSHRTNEIMKVLTIMASIFIPLTFLAGVYGMNFEYMPELAWGWAYFAVLGVMAGVGLGMAAYFKKKGWW